MLNISEKIAYGFGAFGKDFAITTVYLFLMYYLTDTLGLNPAFVGTLLLFARLWDFDPIIGIIINNTKNKFGKFKTWIAIGTFFNAIFLILLFYKPNFSNDIYLYIYITFIYIAWGISYTMMDIPFWSMLPSVATNQKDRAELASILRFCASLAWVIMGFLAIKLITFFSHGQTNPASQNIGYFTVAIILALVFLLSQFFVLKSIKLKESTTANNQTEDKISFKGAFSLIAKNDQLLAFIGIAFAFNLMIHLVINSSLYFYTYVANDKNLFSIGLGLGGIAELIAVFIYPFATKKFGTKKVFALASITTALGTVILLVATFIGFNSFIVLVASASYKFGIGIFWASSLVMLANIVDYSLEKNGSKNESIIFSIHTFLYKFSSAFTGLILGISLSLSGYVAGMVQNTSTLIILKLFMVILPIFLSGIALFVDRNFFKLHKLEIV